MISMIVVIVFLLFQAVIAMNVIPVYMTDSSVKDVMNKLEQDPLYQAEGHLVYNLNKGRWLAFDANYFTGGETSRNGVKSDDRQENSRLGLTFSTPITAHHSIKLVASRGVMTRVGNKFDIYGIFWQYRF